MVWVFIITTLTVLYYATQMNENLDYFLSLVFSIFHTFFIRIIKRKHALGTITSTTNSSSFTISVQIRFDGYIGMLVL